MEDEYQNRAYFLRNKEILQKNLKKNIVGENNNQFNFNNNNFSNISIKLRKANNFLSKGNKKLKLENKVIEETIKNKKYNLNQNDSLFLMKKEIKNTINDNSILIYRILNEVKDIYLLNNNIYQNNLIYNNIKLPKLNFDKNLLNNQKEELKLKIIELKNKKNNLDIMHDSIIQRMKDNKEMKLKLNTIIEDINFRNNYINNSKEAFQKINQLLNEKQKLIEENINIINNINKENINNDDKNKNKKEKEKEEITILREKNEILKSKLNKYDNIIKKINLLNNSKFKEKLDKEIIMDKEITKATQKNENVNIEIESVINKYKKDILMKDEEIEKLKIQYFKVKKENLTSLDNFI